MVAEPPPPDRDEFDPDDEEYAAADEDDGWFPYVGVPYGGFGGWPGWVRPGRPETVPDGEEPYEGVEDRYGPEEDEGTWLDEGLITLLLVAGVVLFVFPEPATSTLGIVLVAFGLIAWAIDWLTPET